MSASAEVSNEEGSAFAGRVRLLPAEDTEDHGVLAAVVGSTRLPSTPCHAGPQHRWPPTRQHASPKPATHEKDADCGAM